MRRDLFWIPGPWRGKLAIATRPRGGDWLLDEARLWRQAGLDVAVSLLETDEAEQLELQHEREAAETSKLRFVSFPIPDRGEPASTSHTIALLKDLADLLESGENVAIHCRQGIGRSGLIAAGLLMTSGMNAGQAIGVVSSARGLAVPETAEQLQWLRRLPAEILTEAR